MPVRTINRPGSQLLGANGRDDGPIVSFFPCLNITLFLYLPTSLLWSNLIFVCAPIYLFLYARFLCVIAYQIAISMYFIQLLVLFIYLLINSKLFI